MNGLLVLLFLISLIGLIVGLFNPKLVIRWGSEFTRKQVWKTYGIATLVLFVLVGITAPPETKQGNNADKLSTSRTASSSATTTEVKTKQPQQLTEKSPIKAIKVQVTRVIDGDTIEVTLKNGQVEKVRLIGVDTPETHHPSKPVQPYGPEAENYTRSQLEGKTVWLEKDVQELDKYNRVLAYVWLSQPNKLDDSEIRAKLFNAKLLLDGYGQLLTIPPDVKYVDYYTKYQTEAREGNKGLWAIPATTTTTVKTTTTTQKSVMPSTGGGDTVYITNTGSKYHRGTCRYLSKSKIPISRSDAMAQGYEPCKICNP